MRSWRMVAGSRKDANAKSGVETRRAGCAWAGCVVDCEPPMSSPADTLLSVNDLALSYGNQRLLDGVALAVGAGEKVGLVGRNGCGKTSLLKILTGAERA